jgi:2-oxoisovalerate ferredoxin oxidoreductase beta subunit
MSAVDAQRWVRDVMEKTYPLGVLCDRTKERQPRAASVAMPALEEIPRLLEIEHDDASETPRPSASDGHDLKLRVAGFGGQGVLLLGEVLAEAGLESGLEVSWLPSYGPEMRSGTSNCHVRISSELIDSPMVTNPNVLIAMNEPSLRKFYNTVQPGGWILYNGDEVPEDCRRDDLRILAAPFTHIADEIGDARITNMVMLGALLQCAGSALPASAVEGALHRLVSSSRWLQLDLQAVQRGRLIASGRQEVACHAD